MEREEWKKEVNKWVKILDDLEEEKNKLKSYIFCSIGAHLYS